MDTKKTLVMGASSNPEQYSHMAIKRLRAAGHPVEAIGRSPFEIDDVHVLAEEHPFEHIHTITLYLNAQRQKDYEEYILSLHPKRIIFNPGAENDPFRLKADQAGIETMNACTLVMLSVGAY